MLQLLKIYPYLIFVHKLLKGTEFLPHLYINNLNFNIMKESNLYQSFLSMDNKIFEDKAFTNFIIVNLMNLHSFQLDKELELLRLLINKIL